MFQSPQPVEVQNCPPYLYRCTKGVRFFYLIFPLGILSCIQLWFSTILIQMGPQSLTLSHQGNNNTPNSNIRTAFLMFLSPCTGPRVWVREAVKLGGLGWLRTPGHGARKLLWKIAVHHEGQPSESGVRLVSWGGRPLQKENRGAAMTPFCPTTGSHV